MRSRVMKLQPLAWQRQSEQLISDPNRVLAVAAAAVAVEWARVHRKRSFARARAYGRRQANELK